jgi:hypothetical protein
MLRHESSTDGCCSVELGGILAPIGNGVQRVTGLGAGYVEQT